MLNKSTVISTVFLAGLAAITTSCRNDSPAGPSQALTGPTVFIGAGILRRPQGIAVDGGGNVWVADTYNNRIRKYSSSGIQTDSINMILPGKIAIDRRTGDLLVTGSPTTVYRYIAQTKTLIAAYPLSPFSGDASAVFDVSTRTYNPLSVVVRDLGDIDSSPTGEIYVATKGSPSNCVVKILNGNMTALAGSNVDSSTSQARFLAVDASGTVFTSFSSARGASSVTVVYSLSPGNMTQSHSFAEPSVSGSAQGSAIDQSGTLYIADPATQSLIIVSTLTEKATNSVLIPGVNGYSVVPRDVAVSSSGTVYVVVNDILGSDAGAVVKYTKSSQ